MGQKVRILTGVVLIAMSFAQPLFAAAPARQFPYSRQTNLAPGAYTFVFTLYDSRTATTPLWTSGKVALTLKTPVLIYTLGSGRKSIPAGIDFSKQLFVKVVKTFPLPVAVIANRERFPVMPYSLSSFGQSWIGSNDLYGLRVENGGAGDGIEASTPSAGKSAFYGHSTAGYGATLRSAGSFGAQIGGGGDSSYNDHLGDLLLEGNRAEIHAPGNVLELFSNGFIALDLDDDNNGTNQFEIWNGAETLVFKVDENGNTVATGSKSAVVQTPTYGRRLMYAVESPEVWFEDFGTASLVNGTATVPVDPVFAETVNLTAVYHVFVTAACQEPVVLFVSEKRADGFTVEGVSLGNARSSCSFDYRLVAKRLGNENARLESFTLGESSRGALE